MAQSSSKRTIPSAGSLEDFGMVKFEDVVDGSVDVSTVGTDEKKVSQNLVIKQPAQLLKIASQVTTVDRDYPYDGTSAVTVAGSTTTVINLATTSVPLVGMFVLVTDGALIGEVRRISSLSGTNATVNRAYGSAPGTGIGYRLLVPAFLRTRLLLKGELSTSGVGNFAKVLIKHFAYPRTPVPALKNPECYIEGPVTLANLSLQGDTIESAYYHLGAHARDVEGSIGFKVRLIELPGGTLSLWAACV